MSTPTTVALLLAAGLILFGGVTGWFQLRGLAALRRRSHVPSDELSYFRGRYRRRLITGGLIVVLGGLIAGAYLSDLEPGIDAMINHPDPPEEPNAPREMTPEQKQLVRVWGGYWTVVVVLVFVVLGMAFADAWATRRYALQQYRILREDHEAKLRRDLAVYRIQREGERGGRGGTGSSPDLSDDTPTA